MEYVIWIMNKSVKKLFVCISTHVFKRHVSVRISRFSTSAEERVEPHFIPRSAESKPCGGSI